MIPTSPGNSFPVQEWFSFEEPHESLGDNMKFRVLGLRIKPGIIAALVICIVVLASFRNQVYSLFGIVEMAVTGVPNYCSFSSAINTVSYNRKVARDSASLADQACIIVSDPMGIDLVDFGSRKIWTPHGSIKSTASIIAEQNHDVYKGETVYVRPGDVVLDVGAHIGLFTLNAIRKGASKVVAIEPAPLHVECIRRNLRDEILSGKVIVYSKGAWDKDGFLDLKISRSNPGANSFVESSPDGLSVRVPITTIDAMMRDFDPGRVDFVKMDIEGAERQALAGAALTIRRFHPRMAICVYHRDDDPIAVPAAIKKIADGYMQECGDCSGRPRSMFPRIYFFFNTKG
jgi:FkbM family methyltransferase